jgi:hypothetical protein
MKNISYHNVLALVFKVGFTLPEIGRLVRLRRTYAASELDQAPMDRYHLEFARWLVTYHRVKEQLDAHHLARE